MAVFADEHSFKDQLAMPSATPQSHWLRTLDEAERFHAWVFDAIGELPGPRLLEVGCGIGTYTRLLAAKGYEVTASDLDADYVAATKARFADDPQVSVRLEDATSPPQDGELWDSALMLDVLEHLPDDAQVLQDLARRLRPGGMLALKVPAHEWLRGSLDDAVGHYRRYSRASLAEVCTKAGYDVVTLKPLNALSVPGWWINAKWLKRTVAPAYQVQAFERLVPLARLIDAINPFPFGASLVVTARKR